MEESNDPLGFDVLEMDMRQYDPAIGRFTSIDPVTHFSMSPYMAFDGNPVVFADPSGADGECYTCIDSGSNGMLRSPSGDFRKNDEGGSITDDWGNEREKKKKKEQNQTNYPEKIDLTNKNTDEVLEQVIAWAIYILENNKKKNAEEIYLSDIVLNKSNTSLLNRSLGLESTNKSVYTDNSGNVLKMGIISWTLTDRASNDYYNIITDVWDKSYGVKIDRTKINHLHIMFTGHRKSGNSQPATLFYLNFEGNGDLYKSVLDRINNPQTIPLDGKRSGKLNILPIDNKN